MDAATDTIAVFPLGTVLLPGSALPLHVFEPRYRAMLADLTGPGGRNGFGVVALHRGTEAGDTANSLLADVGTMAEILDVRPYPDGTSDLLTVGSRRFRVLEVAEAPAGYLRARVEWLAEHDGALRPGDVDAAREQVGYYEATLSRMLGPDVRVDTEGDGSLPADPAHLSYALGRRLQLDLADRQRLLAAPTAADRIRMTMAMLRRETVLLRLTRSVPVPVQALRLVHSVN